MAAPTNENGDVLIFDADSETTSRKLTIRKIHISGGSSAGAVKLTGGASGSEVIFDGRVGANGNVHLNFDTRGFFSDGLTATTLEGSAKVMVYV